MDIWMDASRSQCVSSTVLRINVPTYIGKIVYFPLHHSVQRAFTFERCPSVGAFDPLIGAIIFWKERMQPLVDTHDVADAAQGVDA